MWGRERKRPPSGTLPGSHQLSGNPLTSQPVPNEGRHSGEAGEGHRHPQLQSGLSVEDRSMHLEHFLELPVSKLYLMESMHSK